MGAGYRPEPEIDDVPDPESCVVLWQRRIKKTRKPWVCDSCGREHPAGGPKDDAGTIFEGDFERHQTCVGLCCVWPPRVDAGHRKC